MTDYDLTPDKPEKPKTPVQPELEPELAEPHSILVKTGKNQGVLSLKTGKMDPILQVAAAGHATFQAEYGQMGHQRWGTRSKTLFSELPLFSGFREVCAYSGYDQLKAAENIFESWRQSPAHWVWVNGPCDIWGFAMYQNAVNKLWYACGIFADRR